MRNLYAILEIQPDASPEEIKRAYRKKSKETHPDTGGDAEAFREVQTAFDILSSEEKRKAYDASGDAESTGEELTRIEAMLKASVSLLIRKADATTDMVAHLKGELVEACQEKRAEIDAAEREIRRLESLQGHHSRKESGTNIFEEAIRDAIRRNRLLISTCEADLKDGFEMLAYLSGYTFTPPRVIASSWTRFSETSERETAASWLLRNAEVRGSTGFMG